MQNCQEGSKTRSKKVIKKDLVLERPGFGGFVIDFQTDVHEVVHAHRIFEALLHKNPFGATLPCRCNLVYIFLNSNVIWNNYWKF